MHIGGLGATRVGVRAPELLGKGALHSRVVAFSEWLHSPGGYIPGRLHPPAVTSPGGYIPRRLHPPAVTFPHLDQELAGLATDAGVASDFAALPRTHGGLAPFGAWPLEGPLYTVRFL